MMSFFEYLEMSRPTAAVAKNTAGSNSGRPAVLPFVLGARSPVCETSRLPSIQAGAQLSLSHRAWVPLLVIPVCMRPDTEILDREILCQKWKVSSLEQLPSFR